MIILRTERRDSPLTRRERQILPYVAIGESAKEIAKAVKLAPRTVERYIENMRHKLGARNRTHLVAMAIASGEIRISDMADRSDAERAREAGPSTQSRWVRYDKEQTVPAFLGMTANDADYDFGDLELSQMHCSASCDYQD